MPTSLRNTDILFNDSSTQNTAARVAGLKNRVINGDMRIDQRLNGAVLTANTIINRPVDRFALSVSSGMYGTLTCQRSSLAPSGFTNSFQVSITSASSGSMTINSRFFVYTWVENVFISDLNFVNGLTSSALVLSFWVRSSIAGLYSGAVTQNNNSGQSAASLRGYVFEFTINSANTWEYKTVAIPADSITIAWGAGLPHLGVYFDLGSGSNVAMAPNAWTTSSSRSRSTNTCVQLNATAGAQFNVTGVQLEPGAVATNFDIRSFESELARCQRYYWTTGINTNHFGLQGYQTAGNNVSSPLRFPVEMRAAPSVVFGAQSLSNTAGLVANTITSSGYLLLAVASATGTVSALLNNSEATHSAEL